MGVLLVGLITLAVAKDALDIPTLNTNEDTRIQGFVDAASAYIQAQCNRTFAQATYTHYFDGNDTRYLLLYEFPISAITLINIDDTWAFAGGTDLPASGDYRIHNSVLAVRRCGLFQYTSAQAVKVTYTAGYTTIPSDIQQATLEMVLWLYFTRNDRRKGLTAKSKLGENVAYTDGVPVQIDALIAHHKRDTYIADQLQIFPPSVRAMIMGAGDNGGVKAKG